LVPPGKLLGVGWAKTGTTTLGRCFELLGFSHQAGRLDLVEHLADGDVGPVLELARDWDAFEDWPWLLLYREFDAAFPGSRFVLTTRDPADQLESWRNMLRDGRHTRPEVTRARQVLYGLPFPDVTDEQVMARVQQHEADVRSYFADRPDDLLEVDWTRGDGWPELCGFLDLPVPDEPFPHANRGAYD
jgi:hypothetical protein